MSCGYIVYITHQTQHDIKNYTDTLHNTNINQLHDVDQTLHTDRSQYTTQDTS